MCEIWQITFSLQQRRPFISQGHRNLTCAHISAPYNKPTACIADLLCIHVRVLKVKVLQGCYKWQFHTARQKRSRMVSRLLFSPEKQGLQIPNMLWRLETNSVKFWAPYGDKVLTSCPIRGWFFLAKSFSTCSTAKIKIKQERGEKRRPAVLI